MAYVTGFIMIDAPASALNNSKADEGSGGRVKQIRTPDGDHPYVSAQALRFWLRTTLAAQEDSGWRYLTPYKEGDNVAFTDANPIEWWDDDLFGYMRAPSSTEGRAYGTGMATAKKKGKEKKTKEVSGELEAEPRNATAEKSEKPALTRISPFRVSSLVSVAPVKIVSDFGAMTRHEGNPVLHRHEFYRAHLQGLFSLDLTSAGTFYVSDRVGYKNLDQIRCDLAVSRGLGLERVRNQDAYRLALPERQKRVATLIRGLASLEGGAKQALHYTDVSPAIMIAAVTRGGNHIFSHLFAPGPAHHTRFHHGALAQALDTFGHDILSPLYIGWMQGFLDDERDKLKDALATLKPAHGASDISHPRSALLSLAADLEQANAGEWYA